MTTTPKYPHILIQYEETGEEGEGIIIWGMCIQEMLQLGISEKERQAFSGEATSGDYEHFKEVASRWVTLELTG